MITKAYKVTTHDLRPPIQGGDPIWDGRLPHKLQEVKVDTGPGDCKAGWNACRKASDALRIAGLWPNGRPSRLFAVETDREFIERGDKLRAASWTITAEIKDISKQVLEISKPFGKYAAAITREQMLWREALGRPKNNRAAVKKGLRAVLKKRGLDWDLEEHYNARDAGDAWAARVTWAAGDAWAARDAGAAGAARDARAAGVVRDAWAARDALSVWYAVKCGWLDYDPYLLTTGLRAAYKNGLEVVVPTEEGTLGFAMAQSHKGE